MPSNPCSSRGRADATRPVRTGLVAWVLGRAVAPAWASALLLVVAAVGAPPSAAQPHPPSAVAAGPMAAAPDVDIAEAPPPPATLRLNQRRILEFRAPLLGDLPEDRAAAARAALEAVAPGPAAPRVTHTRMDGLVRFEVDGRPAFFLAPGDVPGARSAALFDAAAAKVERRLAQALAESAEAADPRRLAIGAAWAIGATVLAAALMGALVSLHRLVQRTLRQRVDAWHAQQHDNGGLFGAWVPYLRGAIRLGAAALAWGVGLLLVDLWAAFVLRQFAWTRPWGERSSAWLLALAEDFAAAALGATPGLLTALAIFALARLATSALRLVLQRVERGEVSTEWLDRDTALPTRRLGSVVIWLFALALAYPYLPGATSESFKGVTVLAGLMLSLGATGMVGQVMSGVSLMYARTLRVGEYVRIGEVEGTVTAIGMFATALRTGTGELVSLPNALIVGQPVRNYTRTAPPGTMRVQATVTIGYATPWRQVNAMLLAAARGTEGLVDDPAPFVVQAALADFYVEYRLCACARADAPGARARVLDALHARIQDTFNEQGVQIMSPHYIADPDQPQVVPHGPWFPSAGDGRG